ncbi:hypothetical protein GQ43DRAFT_445144 [Delitschia confertaspora ATCC 74209]|uniref:HTH APSES-type domain-containing protein n=1 Tax=Delitschia confertaspora ATCC 74209 TaxID=1513339 RepID=A0A9P4MMS0_9PLEO|nr:hypothetical protein GQ43DRAFT_445144 [Delitschia confertaspora ATCC 74209]
MVSARSLPERQYPLPEKRNPLLAPEKAPSYESLVDERKLSQTNFALKPGVVGVANSAKPGNLGTFDYAHLRAPLPKDLQGSGIFSLTKGTSYPGGYYLMRRSSDGYISATGMFKAAFPWASLAEEQKERSYHRSLSTAEPKAMREIAGSVWISPETALQLGEEYGMRTWIVALLDPAELTIKEADRSKGHIQPPPRFDVSHLIPPPVVLPPSSSLRPTRSRTSRSASPSKIATPSRKIASPRKPRSTRNSVKADAANSVEDVVTESTTTASSALQSVMANGATPTESVVSESEAPESSVNGDSVRIEVQETVEQNGEVETTTTNVKVEVPANHPDLPIPETPEEMIAAAKKMVEEANKLEGKPAANSVKLGKRKAEEITVDETEEVVEVVEEQLAKRAKRGYTVEQKLKKEKITTRALVGVGLMAAFGTAVQMYFGA